MRLARRHQSWQAESQDISSQDETVTNGFFPKPVIQNVFLGFLTTLPTMPEGCVNFTVSRWMLCAAIQATLEKTSTFLLCIYYSLISHHFVETIPIVISYLVMTYFRWSVKGHKRVKIQTV